MIQIIRNKKNRNVSYCDFYYTIICNTILIFKTPTAGKVASPVIIGKVANHNTFTAA